MPGSSAVRWRRRSRSASTRPRAPGLAPCAEELRFYFITSDVRLVDGAGPDAVALGAGRASVRVAATAAPKCVRCWQHRADVGTHASHPELCGRCVANVDGPGEVRRWF